MSEDITNAVLDMKLDGIRDLMEERFDRSSEAHKAIRERLDKLNGQVAKNTEFRLTGSVRMNIIFAVAAFISSMVVPVFITRVL